MKPELQVSIEMEMALEEYGIDISPIYKGKKTLRYKHKPIARVCSQCNTLKAICDFGKHRGFSGGYEYICRQCRKYA